MKASPSMADLITERLYSCQNCRNQISRHDDIISKGFQVSAFKEIGVFFFFFLSLVKLSVCLMNLEVKWVCFVLLLIV